MSIPASDAAGGAASGVRRVMTTGLRLGVIAGLFLTLTAGPARASLKSGSAIGETSKPTMTSIATSWAHPVQRRPIRFAPRSDARQIVSTHFLTGDGFAEVYLVLRTAVDSDGRRWDQVRIPMRPNGRIGWVRASALGLLFKVRTVLIVRRDRPSATLFRDGSPVWRAPVGVGKRSTPTPPGRFWIREKFRTHDPSGLYGPMAFGTSDYSVLTDWPGGGVIGIHGTDQPGLIPGHPSHGCIRVRNGALRRLWQLMPIGTAVLIRR